MSNLSVNIDNSVTIRKTSFSYTIMISLTLRAAPILTNARENVVAYWVAKQKHEGQKRDRPCKRNYPFASLAFLINVAKK